MPPIPPMSPATLIMLGFIVSAFATFGVTLLVVSLRVNVAWRPPASMSRPIAQATRPGAPQASHDKATA